VSGERTRVAAGMLAAAGMIGAAVVSVVSIGGDPTPPIAKVEPSRDEAITDELIKTFYGHDVGFLCCDRLDQVVHGLIDEHPDYVIPHPRISVGQPMIAVEYDRRTIRRFVRYRFDQITRCYDHRLRDSAGIGGVMTVQFLITRTGAVTSVIGAGFDGELADCVAHVIGGIVFPKPADLVQVVVPLIFHPTATLARPARYEDQWSRSSLRVHAPVTASLEAE